MSTQLSNFVIPCFSRVYYQQKPNDGDIKTDDQKLNTWVVRYSQAVNTNLCDYFEWWQFPLTAETKAACAELPALDEDLLAEFRRKFDMDFAL